MLVRILLMMMASLWFSQGAHAVHVIMTGGPSVMKWEGYRIKEDRHDNWWANFVRASTIRIAQIQAKEPNAGICWIVFKPGYVTRGREDNKPYVQWIGDLAKKYKVKLVWVDTANQAITALNRSARGNDKIQTFFYFGHSNPYAFLLDYSNNAMAVSTEFIHETDLPKINPAIFHRNAECWSYGCYTGMSMSYWWHKFLGVSMWGNMKSTRYGPVSSGRLPDGVGKWVK